MMDNGKYVPDCMFCGKIITRSKLNKICDDCEIKSKQHWMEYYKRRLKECKEDLIKLKHKRRKNEK